MMSSKSCFRACTLIPRLSEAPLEASDHETSLQSKLDELTGKPADTAPSPEESTLKKEFGLWLGSNGCSFVNMESGFLFFVCVFVFFLVIVCDLE